MHGAKGGQTMIRRVFELLCPLELERRFEAWMGEICPAVKGRIVAIDGKAGSRRAAVPQSANLTGSTRWGSKPAGPG